MKKVLLLLSAVVLVMMINSCQKSGSEDVLSDVTIAEDEVFMLKSSEAVDELVTAASFGGHMTSTDLKAAFVRFFPYKEFPECAEVTVSTTDFPKEIIIDYGDDCFTRNGLPITGKITFTISDTIINEGAEITVVYDNVTIGERSVDREATILNEGQNEEGNWVISTSMVSTVTYGDDLIIKRDYAGEKEWINGFLTPQCFDDQLYQTGGGTITVNDELVFTRTITVPLYIDKTCRFILSGVVEISRGEETMTIDYGDGECDNIAVVTKDGVSEEIELNSGRFGTGFQRHLRHIRRINGWW